jgi:hypothetical protein
MYYGMCLCVCIYYHYEETVFEINPVAPLENFIFDIK